MSISAEMQRDLESAIFLFAYDGSKKINAKEVGPTIRSVGLNPTEEELKEINQIVTSKFGGSVDAEQLIQIIAPRTHKFRTSADELREAFLVFDKTGSNQVSVSDLQHSLTLLGERLPPEVVDEMVRELDKDDERQINIDDAVKLLIG